MIEDKRDPIVPGGFLQVIPETSPSTPQAPEEAPQPQEDQP